MVEEFGTRIEPHEQSFLGFQSKDYGPGEPLRTVVLGNAIFPRSLFRELLFDESLRAVYEEVDLTTRAVAKGYQIRRCEKAMARHHPSHERNRYGRELDVARIYVTSKRYGFTEGRRSKAAVYLFVATGHMVASAIKRGGVLTIGASLISIAEVARRLRRYARYRRHTSRPLTSPMKVSVLIPSWRRPEALSRCLDGLERQARPPDQLVLSIRGDDAETRAMVADRRPPFPVHVVTPTGSGVIAALNTGLDQVDGDIVAFTDDDAVPRRDWLQRIEVHFRDQSLGGLGGRDRIIENGAEVKALCRPVVGRVLWFGRVVGNHHLGSGPAREVDILKGASMALRREAISQTRLDPALRGRGVEDNWEIDLSLGLRAARWKLVYDPAVLVDHPREQRFGGQRAELASAQDRYDATHNEAYALLKQLSGVRRLLAVGYALMVGTRNNPGPLLAIERLLAGRPLGEVNGRLRTACSARLAAFRTWWRWRRSTR